MDRNIEENLFTVGPVAAGASFFGRKRQIRELESVIIAGRGARNLVGPTRIGKTSLVNRVFERNRDYPNRLFVSLSMGDYLDAFAFWMTLADEIEQEVRGAELWNPVFEDAYGRLHALDRQDEGWFTPFQMKLYAVLEAIGRRGCRLVLAIDEFDAVERIFGEQSHYYQTLRTIFDTPKYAVGGVLVSRRRLQLFEAKCEYISTFHGVFPEMQILPFSEADMKEFFEALDCHGIKLSTGGKKRLERYTGNMPYLCCMFGERMVFDKESDEERTCGDKDVDEIFRRLQPMIDRHYRDLTNRLEEDKHLEFVFYLSLDSRCPNITDRDIGNMKQMGILFEDPNENPPKLRAFSRDFMSWFRLQPLQLPTWETMTQSEIKLKRIFAREFPELEQIRYPDLTSDGAEQIKEQIRLKYPELQLNWPTLVRYLEDLIPYKPEGTALDVLTLSKVTGVILDTWDTRFSKYFGGDSQWRVKLETIRKLRNPMAHAQLEFIGEEELAVCLTYCSELIRLHY